jgi:hypothetical protein
MLLHCDAEGLATDRALSLFLPAEKRLHFFWSEVVLRPPVRLFFCVELISHLDHIL